MVFKVNWEKAHTRYYLPRELIDMMINHVYPDALIESTQIIEGGCANINVRVQLYNFEKPFILRVYYREPSSAYREKSISKFLKGRLLVPQTYHIGSILGYTFAITEFIDGIPMRDLLLGNNNANEVQLLLFEAGKMLAEISSFQFNKAGFFNENLEVVDETKKYQIQEFCINSLDHKYVMSVLSKNHRQNIRSLIMLYGDLVFECKEKNLVHGDFDPANILVNRKGKHLKITGVLDWEFAFSGSTLSDVGKMLRYAHFMPEYFVNSFINGLLEGGYFLPSDWNKKIKILNILSLLSCLQRSDPRACPNQTQDIKELLQHIIDGF